MWCHGRSLWVCEVCLGLISVRMAINADIRGLNCDSMLFSMAKSEYDPTAVLSGQKFCLYELQVDVQWDMDLRVETRALLPELGAKHYRIDHEPKPVNSENLGVFFWKKWEEIWKRSGILQEICEILLNFGKFWIFLELWKSSGRFSKDSGKIKEIFLRKTGKLMRNFARFRKVLEKLRKFGKTLKTNLEILRNSGSFWGMLLNFNIFWQLTNWTT